MVAEVDERLNFAGAGGAVEEDGEPVGFIHVVGGEEAGLTDESFDEVRFGFKVEDVGGAGAVEVEGGILDLHEEGEPFAVVSMAKNRGVGHVVPGEFVAEVGEVLFDVIYDVEMVHK